MNKQKKRENADKLGVSVEVYALLRDTNRKIRYLTYDLKTDKLLVDRDRITIIPGREVSFEQLVSEGRDFASKEKSVEDIVLESIMQERLHAALAELSENDRQLMHKIFYQGKTEREIAKALGITQQAVSYHKRMVLKHLRKLMEF